MKRNNQSIRRRFKESEIECLLDFGHLQDKFSQFLCLNTSCCAKGNCLKNNFNLDKNFATGASEFDYIEAKKCFEHYLSQYQHLTVQEWDMWIYNKFISTCYGLDKTDTKIIHSFRLSYGPSQNLKTIVV